MYPLNQALTVHHLIVLRVIGEWWELDLTTVDEAGCIKQLAETVSKVNLAQELNFMVPEEAAALKALIDAGGRLPVAAFTRAHGEVRDMGPGALEREEPWYDPVSAAEALWYRGLIYRGFNDADGGVTEYVYLPNEFVAQVDTKKPTTAAKPPVVDDPPSIQPAEPAADYQAEHQHAIDDLTTLLILAQGSGLPNHVRDDDQAYLIDADANRQSLLLQLAYDLALVRERDGVAKPTRGALAWLKEDRHTQHRALLEAWSGSGWNALWHMPTLVCEGSGWMNDPLLARTTLLGALPKSADWFRIDDVIAQIKENTPDFQRPDGDYDSWYVRPRDSQTYHSGFESWDVVEGELLRYLITGPLFWLGGSEFGGGRYRLTEKALSWLAKTPIAHKDVDVPVTVNNDATITIPHNAGRQLRFQAARVAELQPTQIGKPYTLHITPAALETARENGIGPERVITFLEKASGKPVPAGTRRAIERWAANGIEARVGEIVVLRVNDADILDKLRQNPRTKPFIGESIGDRATLIRRDDWPQLQQVAAQLGLLIALE